jgi:hypothetical protein
VVTPAVFSARRDYRDLSHKAITLNVSYPSFEINLFIDQRVYFQATQWQCASADV